MGAPEAILHAISVEPATARCGEDVEIVFRTRNYGTAPSPAATVTFVIGTGLEPLDATELSVAPVDPGADVIATVRARVATALPDRTEIGVGAVLTADEVRYRTNTGTVLVRSTAVLDGPRSGTFIDEIGPDSVRVRAVVTNEGDGPAQHVRLRLTVPFGCEALDDGEIVHELRRLDPGESYEAALDARVVAPVAELDGAVQVMHDAGSVLLPLRSTVRLAPAPVIADAFVAAERRTARVVVALENRGWADAHAVTLQITEADHTRSIVDGATVDAVPLPSTVRRRGEHEAIGRIRRDRTGVHIEIATLAARSTARIEVPLAYGGGIADGSLRVVLGDEHVELPFVPKRERDVRAHAAGGVRRVAPGEELAFSVRVMNAGDVEERLTIRVDGAPADDWSTSVTLPPGTVDVVAVPLRVPADAVAGATVERVVVVENEIEACARATLQCIVRAVAPPCVHVAPAVEPVLAIGGTLSSSGDAVAGVPFALRLSLDVAHPVRGLRIRVPASPAAVYVANSTELDDHALLDRCQTAVDADASPLGGEGLLLSDVAAGSQITVRWSIVAASDDGEPIAVTVVVDADNDPPATFTERISVSPRHPFAVQPPGLPYQVAAYAIPHAAPLSGAECETLAIAETVSVAPALPQPEPRTAEPFEPLEPFEPRIDFDARRLDDLRRLVGSLRVRGLVAHLFLLRLFFPDESSRGGAAVLGNLATLAHALYDVFDRLYVKLRIPGFVVCTDDLEDAETRRALRALVDAWDDGAAAPPIDPARLSTAPHGAPEVLRALLALMPIACGDASLTAAFSVLVLRLDGVLARYAGAPLELFEEALATLDDRALNDARDVLLEHLAPYGAPLEAVC